MKRNVIAGIMFIVGVVAYNLVRHNTSLFGDQSLDLSQKQIDSLLAQHETQFAYSDSARRTHRSRADEPLDAGIEMPHYETFPFDPNTADTTALLRLGFPRWMIRTMLRYRAAGGRYREVEDVKRIPGMTPEIYERIERYITIDKKFKPYDRQALEAERQAKWTAEDSARKTLSPRKLAAGTRLDLNHADSAQLCQVPGISTYRARQIIARRSALGGFISVSQLSEITDMPDSCANWFVVSDATVTQLNINTATLSALKRHPYIGPLRAAAIDRYRRMHGKIGSLDELSLHPDFTADDIRRLQPYVTF